MLPASQTDAGVARSATQRDNSIVAGLTIGLILYTMLIVWGLLSGWIPPQRAYLLMTLACVVPMIWCGYGFLKVTETEQDFGLLLSAIGWALAALALLIKHTVVNTPPVGSTIAAGDEASSIWVTICALLAVVCVLAGAALSLHAWSREMQNR